MSLRYSKHFFISNSTYVDQSNNPLKLVYSGRSGELLALTLDEIKFLEEEKIPVSAPDLVEQLKKVEILVQDDKSDLEHIISENIASIKNADYLDFVILPSSYCNMGCTYCGQSHQKGGIDNSLETKIVKHIAQSVELRKPKSVYISWFGGEPMVGYAKIKSMSQQLIALADQNEIRYYAKIVTNGSLLTMEKLLYLHEECRITEMHITFDGPELIHDKRRILKNGATSFKKVIELIKQALDEPRLKQLKYVFRTNVDNENDRFIDDYIEIMHQHGLTDKRIGYELKGVYPWSNDVSRVKLSQQKFAEQESKWMLLFLKNRMEYTYLLRRNKVTCITVSPNSQVISSSGKLFSCTEHPLVPQHEKFDAIGKIGDRNASEIRPTGKFDAFYSEVLEGKLPCSSCKLFGVCSGACPKHWKEGHMPCPSIKFNLQDRLDLVAVKIGYRLLDSIN